MVFDKRIIIETLDESPEQWKPRYSLHAHINKSSGSERFGAGASRTAMTKKFEVRYFKDLTEIEFNTQIFRIVYKNQIYNIVDYDDYMENHQTVRLTGEYYANIS